MILAAAISLSSASTPGVAPHADASPDTALPTVQWGPCDPERLRAVDVEESPPDAQCGSLAVPIDYSAPNAGQATLAVIKFPATGPKIGSLVVNPGGPGYSGVAAASNYLDDLPEEIRQRFDFVGFDPRGVGLSTPLVECNTDAERDAQRAIPFADFSPEGVARLENMQIEFARRCLARTGERFLANVGTASVARDLDLLRAALGDEKLTYLGYSYGTFLGATYAEAFPDRVRAMVLDGVVNPNLDSSEFRIEQGAGFQRAFDEFAADCATTADCPLGADPAGAVDAYHALINPLASRPAPTDDPRGLGYADALTATDAMLYSPDDWPDLRSGLSELRGGRGDILLDWADWYWDRGEDGRYNSFSTPDAQQALWCVDSPPVTDRLATVEQDRRLREVAPYESYGEFTGHAPLGWCAFWPVPPTSRPHPVSAPGLPPVLVVSTTGDPSTPYQQGVDLARDLRSPLLTFEGTQHTVVFSSGEECVDRYATDYLIDLSLPPPGATC